VLLQPPAFGVAVGQPVADATATVLPDGRIRMYVFAQGIGVVSAVSNDGINFTEEPGARLSEGGAGQPRIFRLSDGRWRLYTTKTDAIVSFVSDDGLDFVEEPGYRITASEAGLDSLSSPAIIEFAPGQYRMYYSNLAMPGEGPGGKRIGSAISNDLLTWTVEPGFRLGEGAGVLTDSAEHPFPVQATDGSIYLFYGKFTGPGTGQEGLYRAVSKDGLNFTEERFTGLNMGNDPEIVRLPNGEQLVYYGDFKPEVGGMILAAKCSDW
jgi:hypothetical protein